jgi:hypothetical protein
MKKSVDSVTCVFLDMGGVLLSDGWDLHTDPTSTRRALASFGLRLIGGATYAHA